MSDESSTRAARSWAAKRGPGRSAPPALVAAGLVAGLLWPADALAIFGLFERDTNAPGEVETPVPPEYQGKTMPAGWAADPKVRAAGKEIYEGRANPDVNCASCHGLDGKPTRMGRGAPDLSDPARAQEPDDRWFWRVSEGVPRTKMRGWKSLLTEEQRWQVIAYVRSLAKS